MERMTSTTVKLWKPLTEAKAQQHIETSIRLTLSTAYRDGDVEVVALLDRYAYDEMVSCLMRSGLEAGWIEAVGAATKPEGA